MILKKVCLFVVAIFFVAGPSLRTILGSPAPIDKAQDHAAAGLSFARAGNLPKAEAEFRQAVNLSPNDPRYLSNLASILRAEKRPKEAIRYFRKALQFDPENVVIRRNLALALWDSGRLAEAGTELEKVVSLSPNDQISKLYLGTVLDELKNYQKAASLLTSVPELVRQWPVSGLALADAYYHTGQAPKARAILESFTEKASNTGELFSAAQLSAEAGDYQTAEELLTALIGKGHQSSLVYDLLGRIYEKEGNLKKAVKAFDQGIAKDPTQQDNYLDLIRTLGGSGLWRASLEVSRKSVERFPNSASLYEMKGLAETMLLLTSDAIKSYTRALEINPNSAKANLGLAVAQWKAGMNKEAAATFENGIKRFPNDALHYQEYGLMLLSMAKSGDQSVQAHAVRLFQKAVALDGTLCESHFQLGSIELAQGKIPLALQQLETAAKLDPSLGKVHYALWRAYRTLGRSADASRELHTYLRLKAAEEKPGRSAPAISGQAR